MPAQTNPTIYMPQRNRTVFAVESAGGQFSGCGRNYSVVRPSPPDPAEIPVVYQDAYAVLPEQYQSGYCLGRFCAVPFEDVYATDRHPFNGLTSSSTIMVLHNNASWASLLKWTSGRSVAGPNTLQGFNWRNASEAEGFDWGIGLVERAAWDPRLEMTFDATIPPGAADPDEVWSSGTPNRPYTLTEIDDDAANWSLEQYPYGGQREIAPEILAGNGWGYGQTRPCWIISNECWPIFGLAEVPTTVVAWTHGGGGSPQHTAIYHQDLFWWTPDHSEAWTPTTYWDWVDDVDPEEMPAGYYYMGCPNYWDWLFGALTSVREGTALHWATMPAAWNPSYPEGSSERQPNRGLWSSTSILGLTTNHYCTQPEASGGDGHVPHCKNDAGFRIPGFEFSRPSWVDTLQALGECTVLSATAEVYVADVSRHEMKFLFERPRFGTPGYIPGAEYANPNDPFGIPYLSDGRYGFVVYQKSGTPGSEAWSIRMKVTDTVTGGGAAVPDSDNTHVYWTVFRDEVFAATGVNPTLQPDDGVPKYIPRKTPWYPSTSVHWPAALVPLQGARLGHCLIGLQEWASETGGTPGSLDVPRSKKEMTRATFWHPKATSGPAFDYEEPPLPVDDPVDAPFDIEAMAAPDGPTTGDDFDLSGYLDWVRSENSERVTELQNYRYRWLAMEPAGTTDDVVPDDASWHEVDMTAIFEALLADVTAGESKSRLHGGGSYTYGPHTKFRIYPCLPKTPPVEQVAGCRYDDVYLNVAPLFIGMQPDLDWRGGSETGSPFTRHTPTFDNVIFQQFSDWRIRSITATIQKPDLSTVEVTIPTPWG